jgi:hypothetical protein
MSGGPTRTILKGSDLPGWAAAFFATAALYLLVSVRGLDLFGSQAAGRGVSPWWYAACGAVALGAAIVGLLNPRGGVDSHAAAVVAALLAWPVFYVLRTSWLNADGNMLTPRFEADVPRFGAHLTHDEILELFLHSRFWFYTHRWWGWSVVYAYQIVSCTAGAVFVYVLIRLARRLAPSSPWLFVTGVLAGGYMQLFFGDVENYTVMAVAVTCYLLAASRFLAGDAGLWVPAVTLAVAACFHLEAAWLWPSAVYLAAVSRSRQRSFREVAVSGAAATAIVAATFVYFQFNGLPLVRFFSSHAGHALRLNGVFAVGMPPGYYGQQLNLFFLLCPTALLGAALVLQRNLPRGSTARFLAISAASLVLMQLVWRSQIGVLDDWNLYATGGLVASVCIWQAVGAAAGTGSLRLVAALTAAAGWIHTYAWILMNHSHGI